MYAVTGYLYREDKLILEGMWEDLVNFVEELKELNPKTIDRKDFKVKDSEGFIIKEWKRK